MVPTLPENESLRLQALYRLRVLDSPRETAFDRITKLAAEIYNVPMARISLVDADRQWFKSAVGTDVCETSRDVAFCAHAILNDELLLVPDATRDPRFWDNPLVTGSPGIRFYAGAPLITEEGYHVGTLCIEDTRPRELTRTQLKLLSDLAAIVVDQLEQRLLKQRVAAVEEGQRTAEEIYGAIVASIREVVFQLSEDGHWTFINPAWTQISGYSAEETLGRDWLGFVFPEDHGLASKVLQGSRDGEESCETLRLMHKAGRTIYMEATARPKLSASPNRGFTGTLYDATEHRQAEERLQQAKLEAEKASRAKSDFLSRMSHEIRTPMNSLLGFSELLSDTDLNGQQRSYVEIFQSSARRLLTLVNEILDLSKVEAGEMKIEVTHFNAASLAAEVIDLLRGSARHKDISIEVSLGQGVDATFKGDAAKIRQILINLVGNAVKFTAHGRIDLRVHISEERPVLEFEVEDSGPGIPPECLSAIFDAFSQVDASITRRHSGTGLGLAICRQLATLLRGEIIVESQLGRGSTFKFSVPVESPAEAEKAAPVESLAYSKSGQRRVRVLIAEDSDINILLFRTFLESDHDVAVVRDGAAALALVKTQQFDVVLMDIQMPVMDGLTATRGIREWERATRAARVPILALTAHALDDERKRTLEAGCDSHLSKPISKRELLDAVAAYASVVALV